MIQLGLMLWGDGSMEGWVQENVLQGKKIQQDIFVEYDETQDNKYGDKEGNT